MQKKNNELFFSFCTPQMINGRTLNACFTMERWFLEHCTLYLCRSSTQVTICEALIMQRIRHREGCKDLHLHNAIEMGHDIHEMHAIPHDHKTRQGSAESNANNLRYFSQKLVLWTSAGTVLLKTIVMKSSYILVKWLGTNWMDTEHPWIIEGFFTDWE